MPFKHNVDTGLEFGSEMDIVEASSGFGGIGVIAFFAFVALDIFVFAVFLNLFAVAIRAGDELGFSRFFMLGMDLLELFDELGLFFKGKGLEGLCSHDAKIIIN